MLPTPWFERKFNFSYTENIFPCLLERLSGTPLRAEHKLKNHRPADLTLRPDDHWSALEHLGHLGDLEELWQQRIRDFRAGVEVLTPADLQNRATHEAGHNARTASELLERFAAKRTATLEMLDGVDKDDVFRSARHPRLGTPMRLMDHVLFIAEHDDHHLSHMSHILSTIATTAS